jgi:hypothetical protein
VATPRDFHVQIGNRNHTVEKDMPEGRILRSLAFARSQGVPALLPVVAASRALDAAPRLPAEARRLIRVFPKAAARLGPTLFGSPLFLLWLAQASLTRLDRAGATRALESFRGLATLRWRAGDAASWQARTFQLGPSGLAEGR